MDKRIDVHVSRECHEKLRYLAVEFDTSIKGLVTAVTYALAAGSVRPTMKVETVEREVLAFGMGEGNVIAMPRGKNGRRKT